MQLLQSNERRNRDGCWLCKLIYRVVDRIFLSVAVLIGILCIFSGGARAIVLFSWGVSYVPVIGVSIVGVFLAKIIVGKHPNAPGLKNEAMRDCSVLLNIGRGARYLVFSLIFMEMLMSVFLSYGGLIIFVLLYDIFLRGLVG